MIKMAIYGKGGIGKSTLSCNVSSALASRGLTVMQIGCDPKADSTALLHGGERIPTVLDQLRDKGRMLSLEDVVYKSSGGVLCVEAGGPIPGLGCAGRGIINALENLEKLGAYDIYKPDVIIYDVLGDVVCGGFSMPMRKGYADKVFVVASGEKMARYAAANICMAVENFRSRGYSSLGGIILNRRDVENEDESVAELAKDFNTEIVGSIDRCIEISAADDAGEAIVLRSPESKPARQFIAAAERMLEICGGTADA